MGSCMSSGSGDGGVAAQPKSKGKTKAFQGTGNRLGTGAESTTKPATTAHRPKTEKLPAKRVDPSLTNAERDSQREARLAAAEQRQKASGGGKPKKKKPAPKGQPLRGPNTEPLMRWTA